MYDERPEFRCPITMDIMRDPVIGADGHTYERSAIIQALILKPLSPLTRQPMTAASLQPNHALRAEIERWQKSQPQIIIPAFLPLTPIYVQPASVIPLRQTIVPPRPPVNYNRFWKALYFLASTSVIVMICFYIYALATAIGLSNNPPTRRHLSAW